MNQSSQTNKLRKLLEYIALCIFFAFPPNIQAQSNGKEWKIAPFVASNTSSQHHTFLSYGLKVDHFETDNFSASGRIDFTKDYIRVSANMFYLLAQNLDLYNYYYNSFIGDEICLYSGMAGHFPLSKDIIISPELSLIDIVYIGDTHWYPGQTNYDYFEDTNDILFLGTSIGASLQSTINEMVDFSFFFDALYLHEKRHTTLNYGLRFGIKFD